MLSPNIGHSVKSQHLHIVVLGLILTACNRDNNSRDPESIRLKNALKSDVLRDCVSSDEAVRGAQGYYYKAFQSSCGGVAGVDDSGEYWRVRAAIGIGGVPIKEFRVHKTTGAISSADGPTYVSPFDV